MAEPETDGLAEETQAQPSTSPRCRFLRNKGMYVHTDSYDEEANEGYDSTQYWCFKTMKDFGPDEGLVGGQECRDSSRECYGCL